MPGKTHHPAPLLSRRLLLTWLGAGLLFGLLDFWLEGEHVTFPSRVLLFLGFAFFLYLFLKRHLLDPLCHVARYAANLTAPRHSQPLHLPRPGQCRKRTPDELDQVVATINAFRGCLLEDLDKREGTERRLLEHQEKFRRLVERIQSDHFFYSHDTQGNFTYVSPSVETILGHPPATFLGHFTQFLTDSPVNREVARHTEQSIQGIPQPPYPVEVLHRDGSVRTLEVVEFPVWDEEGEVVAVEGLARDVTQARQFARMVRDREAAILANEAKTRFLATMSHEIRTPLNGLLGMLTLLRQGPLTREQEQCLETASHSGRALFSLLNDILDLAKIESGKLELAAVDFAPVTLAREALSTFSSQAEDKGLSLRLEIGEGLAPGYRGDPARLGQVLNNLLGNAIKFTRAGSVSLSLTTLHLPDADGWVEFAVADTGPGIPEEGQVALFEAFSRGEEAMRGIPGSGLGLHISKQLVLAMGGRIGLESTPGLGSRFFFRLPLPASAAPAPPLPHTPVQTAIRPMSILLAEDNRINQEVAVGMLKLLGHACATADDGAEALERLQGERFDLVLMDIHMPGMDGLEATRRIRRLPDPARAGIPIIALTADVFSNRITAFREAGMDATLAKPLEIDTLSTLLTRVARDPDWRRDPPTPVSRPDKGKRILDVNYLEQLKASVGREQLQELLAMLRELADRAESSFRTTGDLETVASEAHRLAGAAANLGLSLLSVSLLELELVATEKNPADVERHVAEYEALRHRSLEAMEEWLGKA